MSNMVWVPEQIMEMASFLSKTQNWKFHGSDQTQNYWLKLFPADQRHITKNNFNVVMEKPEKIPSG
jgi:hypothetical protein